MCGIGTVQQRVGLLQCISSLTEIGIATWLYLRKYFLTVRNPLEREKLKNIWNIAMMQRHPVAVTYNFIFVLLCMILQATIALAQNKRELVRLAMIQVDSSQVMRYNELLREEIEASVRLEPGVITLYGVAEKENPTRVTLFETYADSVEYKAHLATPHFQKYKQGTLKMVSKLKLISMHPILYHRNAHLSIHQNGELYIHLIKVEIDSNAIEKFHSLANTLMLPGIKNEPDVLVMYAVAEKDNPTRISILEVYKNLDGYKKHLETTHYIKYKAASTDLVKSSTLIDVNAIFLGSKPQ